MKLRHWLILTILGVQALSAGTLDISAGTSQTVHTGDTLVYHLLTWNFARNAARFDLPLFPADLSFAIVTAPTGVSGDFSATLESEDRSVTAAFGELKFSSGTFKSSLYSGEVSTLQGYLHISPLLSEALFKAGSIVIALQNKGPDVNLGLPPYLLRQNLFASLSVGSLSVGALPGWVELETQPQQLRLIGIEGEEVLAVAADVPEPRSTALLFAGGAFLLVLSALLRPFSHRGV